MGILPTDVKDKLLTITIDGANLMYGTTYNLMIILSGDGNENITLQQTFSESCALPLPFTDMVTGNTVITCTCIMYVFYLCHSNR